MTATWEPGITLDQMEKAVIRQAMQFYRGNKTHTASSLGIAINTLVSKLKQYEDDDVALELRLKQREEEAHARIQTQRGLHVEQDAGLASQQPMPVQQREEVQKMSPAHSATSDTNAGEGQAAPRGGAKAKGGQGSKKKPVLGGTKE